MAHRCARERTDVAAASLTHLALVNRKVPGEAGNIEKMEGYRRLPFQLSGGGRSASACMPWLEDLWHRAHQHVYFRLIQSAIFSTTSRSIPLKPW